MKKLWFVIGIILVLLLVAGIFFYFITASPSKPKTEIENPAGSLASEQAVLEFDKNYVNYMVFAIGGWKLHNPPLSSKTPKIKVIVDDEVFISEVIDREIKTEKKEAEGDIIIKTTKQEIINAIVSLDMKRYMKSSIEQDRSSIKLKASYITLFSKGYLSLYKEMTGESFTGSIIKIFGQE